MYKTILLTIGWVIAFFLAPLIGISDYIHPQKWTILIFFLVLSIIFHRLIGLGIKENNKNFIIIYLSSIVLRLIFSLLFIGLELYLGVKNQEIFILNFFVLYLCYTIFEIWNLSRNLRQNSESD